MPRILHQTFPSWGELKPRQLQAMETWRRANPTYEIRYWTDRDCEEFVRTIYPELLPSFVGLARAVERADFFRYLVVYSFGGFYADTDVDCTQPLDSWVPPKAALVVGLENEFVTPAEAAQRTYARTRQYEQFIFAAERGHPLLRAAVEHIGGGAATGAPGSDRGVLDRTGPGLWTDLIYEHVAREVAAGRSLDSLLLLPRTAFGVFSNGADGIYVEDVPEGALFGLHGFRGSWKKRHRWTGALWRAASLDGLFRGRPPPPSKVPAPEPPGLGLMPVAVQLGGVRGDEQAQWVNVFAERMSAAQGYDGRDPGATLSAWGNWQGGFAPGDRPRVADVLRGSALANAGPVNFLSIGARGGLLGAAVASLGVPTLALTWEDEDCEAMRLTRETSSELTSLELRCLTGVTTNGARRAPADPLQEVTRYIESAEADAQFIVRLGADALGEPAVWQPLLSPDFAWARVQSLALEISSPPPGGAGDGGSASSGLQVPLSALRERGFRHLFHAGRLCLNKWLEEPYVLREGHCTVDCVPCTFSEDPEKCRSGRGEYSWLPHPSWCYVSTDDAEAVDALVANALKLPPHRAEQLLLARAVPPGLDSPDLLAAGFLQARRPAARPDPAQGTQSAR